MYLDCLDALDQKILTLLTQNARYNYYEIGEPAENQRRRILLL